MFPTIVIGRRGDQRGTARHSDVTCLGYGVWILPSELLVSRINRLKDQIYYPCLYESAGIDGVTDRLLAPNPAHRH